MVHLFDPLSAPCGSRERIRKILCFSRNLVALELEDAHREGWLAVICQDEFGDPKITAANDSADSKPLFARLASALVLYVASTAGSLARLRVFQHGVLVIDEVLRFKIVGIGRCPMLIQRRPDLSISHPRILLLLLLIVHLSLPFDKKLPALAESEYMARQAAHTPPLGGVGVLRARERNKHSSRLDLGDQLVSGASADAYPPLHRLAEDSHRRGVVGCDDDICAKVYFVICSEENPEFASSRILFVARSVDRGPAVMKPTLSSPD